MNQINAVNIYKKQSVETLSPQRLLIMMYDGAIANAEKAKKAINNKDIEKANKYTLKTQEIIYELINSLNMDFSISENLFSLYEFLIQQLIEANINKDCQKIEIVLDFLKELRDTWQEAMEKTAERIKVGEINV